MRDEFDERRDRESREYYSYSDAQMEARGMPPSFFKNGYVQPGLTMTEKLEYARRGLQLAITYIPDLERARDVAQMLEYIK